MCGMLHRRASNANRWVAEMDVPYKLYKGDCLEIMPTLEAGSVDAIITDLPYGTTACEWDSIIPLDEMWKQVKRVLKSNGVFITTASQPFTSLLVMSDVNIFNSRWIWQKDKAANFGVANYRPLNIVEDVLIFSKGVPTYNPQMWDSKKKSNKGGKGSVINGVYGSNGFKWNYRDTTEKYPDNVIYFATPKHNDGENGSYHPTQKPVALYEYLIKTYTNFGETVLDITMGSGTTIIAAMKTGRKSIGIERDPKYFAIAEKRIKQAAQQPALLHEAQQSVHLTAYGAGGRGQNPLQSSFIADDPSAKHGGG